MVHKVLTSTENRDRLYMAALASAFASAVVILVSIAASQILLGVAMALLLTVRTKWRLPPIWLPLSLFLAGTLVALAASPEPRNGLPQVKKFFVFTIVAAVFSTIRDVRTVRWLYLCWGAVGGFVAARGMVQFVVKVREAAAAHRSFYEYYVANRITGFQSHWMTFAGQEMMALLVLLAFLMFGPWSRKWGWVWLGCAGLMGVALLLNETRTVWLAVGVAGIWLLWCWRPWAAVVGPAVVLAFVMLVPGPIHQRFVSLYHPDPRLDSNEFRKVTAVTGLRMIQAHPWLGIGPDEVGHHFMEWVPAETARPLPSGYYGHLHNFYLQDAAERGIPTLLMLLWMLGMVLWHFGQALRRLPAGRSDARFILQAGIASVLGIMVSGLFENNLGDTEVLTVFLVVVTCGYVAVSPHLFRTRVTT